MKKTAYLYVLDTMADWESGYVISELHSGRYFKSNAVKYDIKTIGLNREPITTMGGIKILPDVAVREVNASAAGLLLLPGGATWLTSLHAPVFDLVEHFLSDEIPVGAICGATLGLAANGFLNHRHHTSNDLDYLKAVCPSYSGEPFYLKQPVVADGNLTTASGIAALDFARVILRKLDVFLPSTLTAWYKLYRTRNVSYYHSLMESLPRGEG